MEMSNQKLTLFLQSISPHPTSPDGSVVTCGTMAIMSRAHTMELMHVLWNWQHKWRSQCKGVDGGLKPPRLTLLHYIIQIDLLHCFACVIIMYDSHIIIQIIYIRLYMSTVPGSSCTLGYVLHHNSHVYPL